MLFVKYVLSIMLSLGFLGSILPFDGLPRADRAPKPSLSMADDPNGIGGGNHVGG